MKELEVLKNTSESKMWLRDLKEFEKHYDKYLIEREDRLYGKVTKRKKKIKIKKKA